MDYQNFAVGHHIFAAGLAVDQNVAYAHHSVALVHLMPIVCCNLVVGAFQNFAVDHQKFVVVHQNFDVAHYGLSAAHQNFVVAQHSLLVAYRNFQLALYHSGQCTLVVVALGKSGAVQRNCSAYHRNGGLMQTAKVLQSLVVSDCH